MPGDKEAGCGGGEGEDVEIAEVIGDDEAAGGYGPGKVERETHGMRDAAAGVVHPAGPVARRDRV